METENSTSTDFYILAFSSNNGNQFFLFLIFLLIYLMGVLGNLLMIIVIFADVRLHSPMYIFLWNLSFIDLCYITVTLPKSISLIQCFTQLYFFLSFACTEVILLSCMAYDRYIAIGYPLQYHLIMSRSKCVLVLLAIWLCGCENSLFYTSFVSQVLLCHARYIQQFYCDVKSIEKIACPNLTFYIIIHVELLLLGFLPCILSLMSYTKIICIILHMKSTSGKIKPFSTCSSHLTVLVTFYGTALWKYIRPPSSHPDAIDHLLSVLYTAVTPMLNPLIYSLRNKEVKRALLHVVGADTAK
ncbi:olfactory receptor 1G1-like [Spea bombifrons]|uniref:olfactory receptor 1G1-like n=1 Tax=Spea bombifrons TaxID=233779 RepID=UPI00234A82D2|nr:olfactory receptor 1G1-like [Spea bombifrons]